MSTPARIAIGLACLASASAVLHRDELAAIFQGAPALVEDRAGLLSEPQRARVAAYHEALRNAHDIDYRVLTVSEAGDIEWQAHRHFDDTGVGDQSADGRGLLLVIDTAERRVRLEVSTSLEGVYTDAFVAYVQHRQMVPFFGKGRIADGILATTELIVTRAQDAAADKAFAPPLAARSLGGGATTGFDPGEAAEGAYRQQTHGVLSAGLAPAQVVATYHDAMARRDARPDLPIYSGATARMLEGWVVTPAQMDNVVRAYRKCSIDSVLAEADRAVVRYRIGQRQCAPYFLHREHGEWKLDLTAMSALIRFNHQNEWRFVSADSHPYRFAFTDWRFDGKGFATSEIAH